MLGEIFRSPLALSKEILDVLEASASRVLSSRASTCIALRLWATMSVKLLKINVIFYSNLHGARNSYVMNAKQSRNDSCRSLDLYRFKAVGS